MNKEQLWMPSEPAEITPEEYERQVVRWLKETEGSLSSFNVDHLEKMTGTSGEFTIDAVARFQIFDGAELTILIECKRLKRPVEREVLMALHSKLRDVGAHKAMVFSTSGFQSGAIDYATVHGIAAIAFVDGKYTYFTKSAEPISDASLPPGIPKFAGFMVARNENRTTICTISDGYVDALTTWLRSSHA
ncbi:restriction endonuclease [Anderseniella sp. Alg231-50]|uniref:restriction endonuclease n=1 Tax=Anderseniella sp. Alg231-50 TaxID=1922226 RepID=UPI000D5614FA